MYLLTKIKGWTQQGPMGNDKQSAALIAAGIGAVAKIGGAFIKKEQQKKLIAKKKKTALKQLTRQESVSPEQRQSIINLQKASRQGAVDVDAATEQAAQPIYQQGEAQEAAAGSALTQRGLEGSIIAQETSSKIGAEARAGVAAQARKISQANERTKHEADRKLKETIGKRSELLRQLAFKKKAVEEGADISTMASKQDLFSGVYGALTGFVGSQSFVEAGGEMVKGLFDGGGTGGTTGGSGTEVK